MDVYYIQYTIYYTVLHRLLYAIKIKRKLAPQKKTAEFVCLFVYLLRWLNCNRPQNTGEKKTNKWISAKWKEKYVHMQVCARCRGK